MNAGRSILIVSQYYLPESGAPPIRLSAMARELTRRGWNVRVLTGLPNYPVGRIYPGYEGLVTKEEIVEGVPVRRTWLYPATGRDSRRRILNYLSFTASAAVAMLFQDDADIVFVEAQPVSLALVGLMAKVLRGRPYVYNTPDLQVEYAAEGGWGHRGLVAVARSLEGLLMRKALSVCTVTHAFVDHFIRTRGIDPGRVSFLPNGADTDRLYPSPPDRELAERLGVAGRSVITFAGTHAPYQGLDVILDAAALLSGRPDIAILMVGDGPERRRLVERAAAEGLGNVVFGVSPFDEMRQLMSITRASLVVLKPLEISRKMRLSKAVPPLACGVPVIYAGWGETADIVRQHGVGVVVEPGDAAGIAAAAVRLVDDPDLRDRAGERGRALVEREMSWRHVVGEWERQIERIRLGLDAGIDRGGPVPGSLTE